MAPFLVGPNGLYLLEWVSGGHSVAAVGQDAHGNRWFAPTNWLIVPHFDWTEIISVKLITTQDNVFELLSKMK